MEYQNKTKRKQKKTKTRKKSLSNDTTNQISKFRTKIRLK